MNVESLSQNIKMALEKYDTTCKIYEKYINNNNISIKNDLEITFNFDNNSDEFNCEILGYFDNQNLIWIYSWVLSNVDLKKTKFSRELLDYGLKLEPDSNTDENFMIKSLLVNSRIQIQESIQLDINLAIYTSLLRDKIKFIYPRRTQLDETNYITFYYLVK